MALLIVLLLLLGLGVSVKSHVSLQKRIIGGKICDEQEHLYYVRLESIKGNEKTRCGGSLIHPQWILTAAHCWKSETGWTNRVMLKVHPRTVIHYNQVIQDAPVIYGKWHDIILLKLQTPVTNILLAQLPDCNNRLKLGDIVQLAGDGATTTGPNNQRLRNAAIPAHLQCVDMKVVRGTLHHPTRGHLFYTEAPNKDICYGDAGGAAVYNGMIYGVIHFAGEEACQRATVNLDVCEYLDWIKQKTGLE